MRSPRPAGGALPLGPVLLVLAAMACYQLGAVCAKFLFPALGAPGATALRLGLSALLLGALVRPWRGGWDRAAAGPLLAYGLSLAGLNAFFFLALRTVPVGVAVAVDFLGPLGVAVAYSRRAADLVWVALAGAGVALLMPWPVAGAALDPVGLGFCLCAACCWAAYIVCGRAAAARLSDLRATALGQAVAALVVLPFGVASAGSALVSPAVLPLGLAVAVLSSALPNSLEMVAMTRLPPRVFGVLMSLEPALGALFGLLVLGEHLRAREVTAIVLVILASAGITATAARPAPAQPATTA